MNICSSVMSEIAALYVYGIYMFLNADVLKLTGALWNYSLKKAEEIV